MTALDPNTYVWQHVRTTNDTNGNPRRMFMIYTLPRDGGYLNRKTAWIDEGYGGRPDWLKHERSLEPLGVSPSEFRRLKKRGDEITHDAAAYIAHVSTPWEG